MRRIAAIVLLLCVGGCLSISSAPPIQNSTAVCEQLQPLPAAIEDQQLGDGGIQVLTNLTQDGAGSFTYVSGQTYKVIIASTDVPFCGYVIQARSVPDGNLTGTFTVSDPTQQQTLNCDPAGVATEATASSNNLTNSFQTVNLLWTAPNLTDLAAAAGGLMNSPATGMVNITFTVVVDDNTFYIARNAANQLYNGTPGLETPQDYQLTYRTPSGCIPPECVTFVGVNNSNIPGYLQFYLQGVAQAWVAMGFSLTRSMFDADVMACNLNNQTGMIELLDTWNPSSPTRNNFVDTFQDGCLLNASAIDGMITCTFVRSINGTIVGSEDINLNQTLYGMWGVGQMPSAGMLLAHEVTPFSAIPQTSFQPLNPVLDTDADRVSQPSNDSAAYNLTYRTPSGCMPPNCSSFVGVNVNARNPDYLDFFLQGQANAWVAMGYSTTRNMFDADIMACNVNPDTGLVEVIDAYTLSSPTRDVINDTQQDLTLISSSVQDGIITCTFVTPINKTIVGREDMNLNQSLFGMWGVGQNQAAGDILQHTVTPATSIQPLNPAVDTDENRIIETPRDPEDYRLTLRQPPNCSASNCSVFVGISTNNRSDEFLDIYMEAQTTTWVATGFTATRSMFDADVLACNFNPDSGMVEVLDTWNPSAPTRGNIVDDMQDAVLFSSNITDGRISCTMARYIPGSIDEIGNADMTEDLDLNGDYFILYGVGPAPPATSTANALGSHDLGAGIPSSTGVTVNPTTDNQTALNAVGGIPANVQPPNRDPADYRLTMRNPAGCDPAQCDIFVGIDTNQGDAQYLDITIQGNAQGWVAVGFSDTPNMLSADVMGCSVNQDTGLVQVLDTWNLDQGRGNVGDNIQDTFLFQGASAEGRITCTFGRLTAGSDTDGANVQDLNLNNDYFGMFGVGPNAGSINFPAHNLGPGNNPTVTGSRVNPSTATGDTQADSSRPMLIRAHGILMIIAWPLMAVTAIFFAAWMRPALPNGEWFQVHRILLSGSIFVGAIGFLLIFVANRNNDPPGLITLGSANPIGTTHYVFGIVVMFLHILNPLIAICRCKPDGKFRWIFNLVHGSFVGMVAELLALTNVGIGLAIFGGALSRTGLAVFYVYIGYLGFFLGLTLVLFLLYTILAYTSSGEDKRKLVPSLVKPLVSNDSGYSPASITDRGVELAVPGEKPSTSDDKEMTKPKPPSKDAPVRWFALLIYAVAMIPAMIVLVILVAI